ncbi:hypothetical protein [Vogesella indigofera]|uniref:hypothetical protein n=1 Tax=Vogesella indigofera TaxID=45465 RepID=UPI000EAF12E3|nr:hypothetical protein [Vogesella indigofera]
MNYEYQSKWLGQAGLQLTQALEAAWPFRYEVVISHGVFDGVGYVYIRTADPLNLAEIGNPGGGQNEYPHSLNVAITWQKEDLIRYLDTPPEDQLNMMADVGNQFRIALQQLGHAEIFFTAGRQRHEGPRLIHLDDFDQ